MSAGFWKRLTAGAQPGVGEQLMREADSVSKEAGLAIIKATFSYDPLPAVRAYPGPKLTIVTNETPFDLHKLLPGLPYKQIEGASHWAHMDKPVEFNSVMDEFLATIK